MASVTTQIDASAPRHHRRPSSAGPSTFPHIPALDGLRGLAVAGVLVFHGGFAVMSAGFLGVSTFFTLSGFLIASLLITERTRTNGTDLRRFWARRFRRLMPAAVVSIGAIAIIAWTVPSVGRNDSLPGDLVAALFYVANWRFLFSDLSYNDLFADPSPVQHYWSLAIEEQFYVLFPLVVATLFAVFRGSRRALGGVVVVLLGVSVVLPHIYDDVDRIYYGTDVRMAEILVGILLALAYNSWTGQRIVRNSPIVRWLGLLALVTMLVLWSVAEQTSSWLYDSGFAAYAVLSALVIAAATQARGLVSTALSWRPLVWLGLVSYGAYLYHWPIFLWFDEESTGLDGVRLFALRIALTLAVTWLSYHYLEQPIRRGVRPGRDVSRPIVAIGAAVAVIGVGAVVFSGAFEEEEPTFAFDTSVTTVPTTTAATAPPGTGTSPATSAPATTTTLRATAPTLMVVGDSISIDLRNGLIRRADQLGESPVVARDAAYPGCGVSLGGEIRFPDADREACRNDYDLVYELAAAEPPDVAVVMIGFVDLLPRRMPGDTEFRVAPDPAFLDHLADSYRGLQSGLLEQGYSVMWVNAPCMSADRAAEFGVPVESPTMVNAVVDDVAAAAPGGVAVFDLEGFVCPGGAYTDQVGDDPQGRRDGLHFSDYAADLIADQLAQFARTVPPVAA